ncbi:hypothetical protein [Caballeronia mineralivorans]|uniref:hypothetical protein n=1 Tax=Caballeronia mineralivorans TaxID=2010198 RepID=UPI000ADE02B7|nr:hypothetical protein [Caballeronia mineralivorans]
MRGVWTARAWIIAGYWIKPPFTYTSIIAAPILSLLPDRQAATVTDHAGAIWH